MKATNSCGVFVGGDRERRPGEADACINQLGYTTALRLFPIQWGVADGEYEPVPDELPCDLRQWDPLPLVSAWTRSSGSTCASALTSNAITGSRGACWPSSGSIEGAPRPKWRTCSMSNHGPSATG